MIVVKDDRCTIVIDPDADLAEYMTLTSFRKLLKMASNEWYNDREEVREEIMNQLEREKIRCEHELEREDVFYNKRMKNHMLSVLKKNEKMKSEVTKYV